MSGGWVTLQTGTWRLRLCHLHFVCHFQDGRGDRSGFLGRGLTLKAAAKQKTFQENRKYQCGQWMSCLSLPVGWFVRLWQGTRLDLTPLSRSLLTQAIHSSSGPKVKNKVKAKARSRTIFLLLSLPWICSSVNVKITTGRDVPPKENNRTVILCTNCWQLNIVVQMI